VNTRLGIIGGGQLGLYLCEAAQRLGLDVSIISETEDAPALLRADKSFIAAITDTVVLDQLLSHCDVITFEREDIPDETLAYLAEAEKQGRVAVHPGADVLLLLKDKGLQKAWLQNNNLPTLPFDLISGDSNPIDLAAKAFKTPLVQKARRGGFDGRGVQILTSRESLDQLWDIPSIVEPYLADSREISVLVARTEPGESVTFPPVSMEFDPELNAVRTVFVPADISSGTAAAAVVLAEKVVTLLGGVGVFAIEMFITPDEKLLINEISPRVHNSGHLTLDSSEVSQFEQHVRAITGLPLLSPGVAKHTAMLNILYAEPMLNKCPNTPQVEHLPGKETTVYWYGKKPGAVGRKMGHINAVGPTVSAAIDNATSVLASLSATDNPESAV